MLAALAARDMLGGRPPAGADIPALLFARGERAARDGLLLAAAADAGDAAAWDASVDALSATPPPVLPVGGAEVIARGVRSGRRVGAVLKHLQAAWIRAGFPQEPAAVAALLEEALAAERQD